MPPELENKTLSFEERMKIGQTLPSFMAPQIPKEQLMLTSDEGKRFTAENQKQLSEMSRQLEEAKKKTEEFKLAADKFAQEQAVKKTEEEKSSFERETEMKALGVETPPIDSVSKSLSEQWGIPAETFAENPFLKIQLKNYEDEKITLANRLNTLQNQEISSSAQLLINNIQRTYNERIETQKEINKRTLATETTAGIRFGAARYAPEIQRGILQDVEEQGLSKVSKLQSERDQLIADAISADKQKQYDKLDDIMDKINKNEQDRLKTLKEINDEVVKKNEKINETKNNIVLQENIKILFDAGFETPAEIQAFLKTNGIKADLEKIDKYLKIVKPDESLTGVSADFKTFKQFFPDVDVKTKEGQEKYLDWQRQVAAANRQTSQTDIKAETFDKIKLEAAQIFEIDRKRNEDKMITPDLYLEMRQRTPATFRDDFDKVFQHLLSKESKARFGIEFKQETTVQSVLDKTKKTFQQYKDANYSREDVENQYKAENKLEEIPNSIKKIFDEVFGEKKSWWQW